MKKWFLHFLALLSAFCWTPPPEIKESTVKAERRARYKELQRKAFEGK